MTKREQVEEIHQEHAEQLSDLAVKAIDSLLDAGLPHPWLFVFELTQNALDAGAKRVRWAQEGEALLFEHDGPEPLDVRHVRALSLLGGSTKGTETVGFMGVGFKSVFTRFWVARVSGFGWQFKYAIGSDAGAGSRPIPRWKDSLLPIWDEDADPPSKGYTTRVVLEDPRKPDRTYEEDLKHLHPENPVPLAVLALRGLREVEIDGALWMLQLHAAQIDILCEGKSWTWRVFSESFLPSDEAWDRLLQARRQLRQEDGAEAARKSRSVHALVAFNQKGKVSRRTQGTAFATLPTGEPTPFGFDVQADWLVDVSRQSLRDVEGDSWQEDIVATFPSLVAQVLGWVGSLPPEERAAGYGLFEFPNDDTMLGAAVHRLQWRFVERVREVAFLPIHGATEAGRPADSVRLPSAFSKHFDGSEWRPDLLFARRLIDLDVVGEAESFLEWVEVDAQAEQDDGVWPAGLSSWWESLPETTRNQALFSLWSAVNESFWGMQPVVPTEGGRWVTSKEIRWLPEGPPRSSEPSGAAVLDWLGPLLPNANEQVPRALKRAIEGVPKERWRAGRWFGGIAWFRRTREDLTLAHLISKRSISGRPEELVDLLDWAMSRGANRQDLVPLLLDEADRARPPSELLLADPYVEGGELLRTLFPETACASARYERLGHPLDDIRTFLRRTGLQGQTLLVETRRDFRTWEKSTVAELLGVLPAEVQRSGQKHGYTVFDSCLPFEVDNAEPAAVVQWLSGNPAALSPAKRRAQSHYQTYLTTQGRAPCSWVTALADGAWVLGTDGRAWRPRDCLVAGDPDRPEAPWSPLPEKLVAALSRAGIRFGGSIPKAAALRKLARRGAGELPDLELAALLREAVGEVESRSALQQELVAALSYVRARGLPLDRLVEVAGAGGASRSDLNGWVLPMTRLEAELASALRAAGVKPERTTTAEHALGFLRDVWAERPDQVDSIRGALASAYRYMWAGIDDGAVDEIAVNDAFVRVGRKWLPAGAAVLVDDLQLPALRSHLKGKPLAVSGQLGNSPDEVRVTAHRLGLTLLSDDLSLRRSSQVGLDWAALDGALEVLGLLPGPRPFVGYAGYEELVLQVAGEEVRVSAYDAGDQLLIAGSPNDVAADVAASLVRRYQLTQQGALVPHLALALVGGAPARNPHLRRLAEGLGVVWSPRRESTAETEGKTESPAPEVEAEGDGHTEGSTERGGPGPGPTGQQTGAGVGAGGGGRTRSKTGTTAGGSHGTSEAGGGPEQSDGDSNDVTTPGPNWIGIARKAGKGSSPGGREGSRGAISTLDDTDARDVVVQYEEAHGRVPNIADAGQPGFDVSSLDSGGLKRFIEIKGMQTSFDGDASVLLSRRQIQDAFVRAEEGQWWLYVVDRLGGRSPRVFPIPWPAVLAKVGFEAGEWREAAQGAAYRSRGEWKPMVVGSRSPE